MITFTVDDMNRRSKECIIQGVMMGAEIVLECVADVLAQMEVVERPRVMTRLRESITAEISESVSALGEISDDEGESWDCGDDVGDAV